MTNNAGANKYLVEEELDEKYGGFESATQSVNSWLRTEYETLEDSVDRSLDDLEIGLCRYNINLSSLKSAKQTLERSHSGRLSKIRNLVSYESSEIDPVERELIGGTSITSNGEPLSGMEVHQQKSVEISGNCAFLNVKYNPVEGEAKGMFDYSSTPPGTKQEFERSIERLEREFETDNREVNKTFTFS